MKLVQGVGYPGCGSGGNGASGESKELVLAFLGDGGARGGGAAPCLPRPINGGDYPMLSRGVKAFIMTKQPEEPSDIE